MMRQKVGKERSQGVFAPLAIPRCYPNLAELTPVCECPAAPPGYRDARARTLGSVGSSGYIWSLTIPTGSGYAHYLSFSYSWLDPQSSNYRAYGFPLRCLQEHPQGVLLGFSQPNLNRACRPAGLLPRAGIKPSGRAQPSRGESISFL